MTATWDRRDGIGASEVAAILGASPWSTPVGVWMEKVGLSSSEPSSPAMRAGSRLEVPILRMAQEALALRFIHNTQRHRHRDWPRVRLWATPDGFAPGRAAVVEVKLVGHRYSDWTEGVPGYVAIQVQAQLSCIPRARYGIVAALIGSELRTFRIEREQAVQDLIPEAVESWWDTYVVPEVAPQPTNPEDQWAVLRAYAQTATERQERLAADDEARLGAELVDLLRQRDAIEAEVDERRRMLAQLATSSDIMGVGWSARWVDRRSVDWRSLAISEAIPEAAIKAATKVSTSFVFRRSGEAA